ncbi:MAG TPA: hypothetical protein VLU46_14455 [Thermoanaerobaculia bacterium]|nr:hypothetical protein [Thermoanaerobaculia bacterium]
MRRTIFAVAFLLISAVPAFAVTRTVMVVDDVIRMTKAGVADDAIIAFVRKTAQPFDVNSDDVIAMQEARVSPAVQKIVIDQSSASMRDERWRDTRSRDSRTVVYVSPGIYSPWYDPFYYGAYPYYGYRPYFGIGVGWGRGYYGGGHRGGGHRGGRH